MYIYAVFYINGVGNHNNNYMLSKFPLQASFFFEKWNNNYVKTKKNGPPQANFFEIWYFLNPGVYIFIMKI